MRTPLPRLRPRCSRSPPTEQHRSLAEWVAKLAPRLQLDTSPQQLRIAHVRDGGREVDIWDGKPQSPHAVADPEQTMTLTHSSPERQPSQPLSLSRSIRRAPVASLAPSLLPPPLPRRPGNLARRRRRPMTSQHSAHRRRPPKRTRERARLLLNLRTCQRLYSSLNNLPRQPPHPNPRNASGTLRHPRPNLSLRALLLGNRHPPTRVLKARRPSSPRKKGSEEQGRAPL